MSCGLGLHWFTHVEMHLYCQSRISNGAAGENKKKRIVLLIEMSSGELTVMFRRTPDVSAKGNHAFGNLVRQMNHVRQTTCVGVSDTPTPIILELSSIRLR